MFISNSSILGKTALHYAASNGKEKVGELLIRNGTNVSATDKNGQTALHVAAKKGKEKITTVLIANGANADIVDSSGKTALHLAAQKGATRKPRPLMKRLKLETYLTE